MTVPVTYLIAERGIEVPDAALPLLADMTGRFTSEWAVRPFIARDPDTAFGWFRRWTADPDADVRRLASEGCRPRLPWAPRVPRPGRATRRRWSTSSTAWSTTRPSTCAARWPTTSTTSPRTTPTWPSRWPPAGARATTRGRRGWCAAACARWPPRAIRPPLGAPGLRRRRAGRARGAGA